MTSISNKYKNGAGVDNPANTRKLNPETKKYTEENGRISSKILEEVRAGNQKAFETVYLHYASSVKNFLKTLMRSEDLGNEMTQEVFVLLWENREKIDPAKNISGYIYIIARNIAFKYFRRSRNIYNEDVAFAEGNFSDITPHEVLISKEIELLIDIAVSMMPMQRREIFIMSRKQGLNNKEIAEKLHISKNTVENQLTSALKYLRTMISLLFAIILS